MRDLIERLKAERAVQRIPSRPLWMNGLGRLINDAIAALEVAQAVPAWRPIKTAPMSGAGLLYWARSGHVEDAAFHQNEDGTWGYTLFDGETLNDRPTYWAPPLAAPSTQD